MSKLSRCERLALAVAEASAKWDGLYWDDGDPEYIERWAERMERGEPGPAGSDIVSSYCPYSWHKRRLTELAPMCAHGAHGKAAKLARELSAESADYVRAQAARAAVHGGDALVFADDDNWEFCLRELQTARDLEGEFLDDASWGFVFDLAQQLALESEEEHP